MTEPSLPPPSHVRLMRVFVASPGDVAPERDSLAGVIAELNMVLRALVPEKAIQLELVRWETHVHPAMGRTQEIVNQQIGDYDIFIGIMWKRFGTPTGVACSGTEEELGIAIRNWEQFQRPDIMFYFCQEPFAPPRTVEDAEQMLAVARFRTELSRKGLVGEYDRSTPFADVVRSHLVSLIARKLGPGHQAPPAPEMSTGEAARVRLRAAELAQEYEALRNRLPSGHERTRQMEVIVTRMRSEAPHAAGLVDELTRSDSAGERLMAIALLQVQPRREYAAWLGERFYGEMEKPFVQYHAAVALLAAARTVACEDLEEIAKVIEKAIAELRDLPESTDRRRMLADALHEVRRRMDECSGQEASRAPGRRA